MTKKPIYATTTTAAGLVRAFRLRESLEAVEGELDFRLLVAEHPRVVAALRAKYPGQVWVAMDEIGRSQWLHMAFYYDASELVSALQPSLMRALLPEGDIIYIEPDTQVWWPLADTRGSLSVGRAQVLALEGPVWRGPLDLAFLAIPSRPPFMDVMEEFAEYMAEPERHISGPLAGACLAAATGLWAARLLLRDDVDVIRPGAKRRVDGYHVARDQSPYRELGDWSYSFASYADGAAIAPEQRRAFLRLALPNRRRVVDPFADSNLIRHLWSRSPGLAMEAAERKLRERHARLTDTARNTGAALLERVARALPPRAYAELGRIVRRLRG